MMVIENTNRTPERKHSVDSLSDEELHRVIDSVRRDREKLVGYMPSMDGALYYPVWRIAPDAIVKLSEGPSEAYTMQLVRNNTSIPVPTVRRVLPNHKASGDYYWIIMDYIDGSTLFELWDTLTEERKRSVIDALAGYVRELRSIRLPNPPIPGPLHPDGIPVKCRGSFFSEDQAGPFGSYQEMADWFDRQRSRVRMYNHMWLGGMISCPKFDATHPLVLCHMDIHPRNILIDKNGTPWLIDWGVAGVYPPWFEYAAIAVSVRADHRLREVSAWKDLVANVVAIAGDYLRYYDDYLLVLFRFTNGINFDEKAQEMDFPDDYFEKLGITVD
ncbi:kinase-like protein [Dichomitus squalens]|uniref:Kinase-like protein n=1 Tax=Dichomitus squalens TaxID=114155 RepID=A0A4Q9MF57_9APHY|nr:kinase-like protein [Dichomitus squalens]